MSDKPDNPPAFPRSGPLFDCSGMTLRDWFAGQALQGALAGFLSDGSLLRGDDAPGLAKLCYVISDAMIVARKTGGAS